jgi:hypothetical protein
VPAKPTLTTIHNCTQDIYQFMKNINVNKTVKTNVLLQNQQIFYFQIQGV